MSRRILVLGFIVFLVSFPPGIVLVAFAQEGTPPPELVNDFEVTVGDRTLQVACEGSGSPAVIQEIGGPDPEGGVRAIEEAGQVVSDWLGGARFCGYDRAGTGASPADAAGVRSLNDAGSDLLAVLAAPELNCPCVVLAESLGGGIALAAFTQEPVNFAGLVLLDTLLPGFSEKVLELAPAGSVEAGLAGFFDGENEEMINYQFSLEMLPQSALGISVKVLTHGQGYPPPCPCSAEFPADDLEVLWQQGQSEMAESLAGDLIVAENAGHIITEDDPELVVESILDVIADIGSSTPEPAPGYG